MLWYKAWRESHNVFLICAAVLIFVCVSCVLLEDAVRGFLGNGVSTLQTYDQYIYKLVYSGSARGLYSLFALILGLGGLQRERAQHSAGFTLALPVSRLQLIAVRAVVGLLQIAALSALPVLLIPVLSTVVHQSYPLPQAIQFALLWFICGALIFGAAFLASTMFISGYTALTVTFVALFFSTGIAALPGLKRYPIHIHHIMSGYDMPYFDAHTSLLIGPFPWTICIAMGMATTAVIALAAYITLRRDFA